MHTICTPSVVQVTFDDHYYKLELILCGYIMLRICFLHTDILCIHVRILYFWNHLVILCWCIWCILLTTWLFYFFLIVTDAYVSGYCGNFRPLYFLLGNVISFLEQFLWSSICQSVYLLATMLDGCTAHYFAQHMVTGHQIGVYSL